MIQIIKPWLNINNSYTNSDQKESASVDSNGWYKSLSQHMGSECTYLNIVSFQIPTEKSLRCILSAILMSNLATFHCFLLQQVPTVYFCNRVVMHHATINSEIHIIKESIFLSYIDHLIIFFFLASEIFCFDQRSTSQLNSCSRYLRYVS